MLKRPRLTPPNQRNWRVFVKMIICLAFLYWLMLLLLVDGYVVALFRLRLRVYKGNEWNDHKGMEMNGIEYI